MKAPPPEQLALPSPSTAAHRAICDSRRLGLGGILRVVLHGLARRFDKAGKARPSLATLSADCGLERKATVRSLATLVRSGIVSRVSVLGNVTEYTISTDALASSEPVDNYQRPGTSEGSALERGRPSRGAQPGTSRVPGGGTSEGLGGGTREGPQRSKRRIHGSNNGRINLPSPPSDGSGATVENHGSALVAENTTALPDHTNLAKPKAKRSKKAPLLIAQGADPEGHFSEKSEQNQQLDPPTEKRAYELYAEAYAAGISAGQNGRPCTPPIRECKGQPFGALLRTHAVDPTGAILRGTALHAWIRAKSEEFRRDPNTRAPFLTPRDFGKWLDGGQGFKSLRQMTRSEAARQTMPDAAWHAERQRQSDENARQQALAYQNSPARPDLL